jgi:hypothetical protein
MQRAGQLVDGLVSPFLAQDCWRGSPSLTEK